MITDILLTKLEKAVETKTIRQVAEESGLSPSAISRFLNGERLPSGEACDLLATYFGLRIKEMR